MLSGIVTTSMYYNFKKESGLEFNKEFFVGYSPERINPGDKEHTLARKKISGSTKEAIEGIEKLYINIS